MHGHVRSQCAPQTTGIPRRRTIFLRTKAERAAQATARHKKRQVPFGPKKRVEACVHKPQQMGPMRAWKGPYLCPCAVYARDPCSTVQWGRRVDQLSHFVKRKKKEEK